MGRRKKLPVEPFELTVSSQNHKGLGLARYQDQLLQVHGALPGERVMAQYMFGRKFRNQAKCTEVLEASPDRVSPPCEVFGTCSACALQHMSVEAQLLLKQEWLKDCLKAAGDVSPGQWLPPLTAGSWAYRRKARLSVRHVNAKDRVLVGFREKDGRFVTDMNNCHTLFPVIARQLPGLSNLVNQLEGRSRIPQIEASCGDEGHALVIRHLDPLTDQDKNLLKSYASEVGCHLYLQPKGPDSIEAITPVEEPLSYAVMKGSLSFEFEPLDFVQVNGELNQLMIEKALELLDPGQDHHVLDLFCGLGNFSLPIALQAGQVTGVEGAQSLVDRAILNARKNQVSNARFVAADLYGESLEQHWPDDTYHRVLLDPPRSGAAPVLAQIAATQADRIVYISCNPETLATDAALLVGEHGYSLTAAGIMDMFPQTPHIESIAVFER